MRRWLFALFLLGAFPPVTLGADLHFPSLTGRVVDNANLILSSTEQHLTQILADHERATSNQVVVVTIPYLQGVPIDFYGPRLGNHWGIGQKGKDNGVLLIVAPNERKVRIEVGLGLSATLTNSTAQTIVDSVILPRFRDGNMDVGIREGTLAIVKSLEGSPWTADEFRRITFDEGTILFLSLLILFAGFVVASRLWGVKRRYQRYWRGMNFKENQDRDKFDAGLFGPKGYFGRGSRGSGFSGGGGGFGGGGASGGW